MKRRKDAITYYVDIPDTNLFNLICDNYGVSPSATIANFIRNYNLAHLNTILNHPLVVLTSKQVSSKEDFDKFTEVLFRYTTMSNHKDRRGRKPIKNQCVRPKKIKEFGVNDICKVDDKFNGKF